MLCLCEADMLLIILLLNLVLLLTEAGADAKSSPKPGLEDLENLMDKLVESRLSDLETRMQEKLELRLEEVEMRTKYEKEKEAKEKKELEAKVEDMERKAQELETHLEAKDKEMETRLKELEDKMEEEINKLEKKERGFEASASKLRMEVEESLRKPNFTNNALTKPSLRDLPIVLISAWQGLPLTSPQTVTFDSFLANFNNGDRPGGGSGELDLDSGVFTCFTPGYYTVSFSAHGLAGPYHIDPVLYLFMNGRQLPESCWYLTHNGAVNTDIGVTGSRILVRTFLEMFA